jgi:hypothetical protein
MRENSIFTITPPEMQLSDDGPTITVISTNPEFITKIESAHESMFKTVSVTIYHPDGPVTENNIAWVVSVMRFSDNIFVDLDTATDLSIIGAILSNGNVVFINKDRVRNDIAKLINSMQTDYQIFEEIEDYIEVILHRFN